MVNQDQFDELRILLAEQHEENKKLIKATIEAVVRDRFDVVLRKIDSVQNSIDLQAGDMSEDRKDFAQMKINQSTIAQTTKEMLDIVSRIPKIVTRDVSDSIDKKVENITQGVTDSVQPAVAETLNNFVESHKKNLKPKVKTIWQKLKFWVK